MKRTVLLLSVAGLLCLVSCRNKEDEPDAYGTFEAVEITVSSLANGRLLQFSVEEGMELDSGRVVGYVDTTDLYLKKMQAAEQRNATAARLGDLAAQIAVQEQNRENLQTDQRRIAKTINFGVVYRMSAFRLSNELGIGRSDAQKFIDAYFERYAGVRRFMDSTIAAAEKDGYVRTLLGRRRPVPAVVSRNKTEKQAAERVAVNTPIQGSAADIVKLAMLRVRRALDLSVPEARLLLQVHDELIAEVPEARAAETAEVMKREMEGAVRLSVPLRVDVETAVRWGEMH